MHPKCLDKITVFLLLSFFTVLISPRGVAAVVGPADYVRGMLSEIMAIQTNPKLAGTAHQDQRKTAIGKVILKNFDTDRMAENALGETWKKLGVKQRNEFTTVFRDIFQDSYTRMVLNFLKQEKIIYSPEQAQGKEFLVKTVVSRPNENIPVDYRLEKKNEGWLVADVVIDGVSIVRTYHNSFQRVIKGTSFQELLDKLRLQQKAIRENS